jgi:hypothetical protein
MFNNMWEEVKMPNYAKIKKIKYIGKADVYNMQVKDHHNYSVNGGLIIHNCDALRYYVKTIIKPWRLSQ